MEILEINGVDFGPYLEQDGLTWSKEDFFSSSSGRETMDREMHATKVASKVTLEVTCMDIPGDVSRRLLQALHPSFVTVTFDSPEEGVVTKTFLNRDPECQLHRVYRNGKRLWRGLTFTLEEK